VISFYHDSPCERHAGTSKTATKVLQLGFFWSSLFKDVYAYVRSYYRCQRMGNLLRKNEMSLNFIVTFEIFDV